MRSKALGLLVAALAACLLAACPNPSVPTADPEPSPVPGDTVINQLALPGLAAPVFGAVPGTSLDASQYSGSISWTPAHATFARSTSYTATITLMPKPGYTLAGMPANSFTLASASSVSHAAGSGLLTLVFPATADGGYDSPTIGKLVYVPAGSFQRDATAGNISQVSPFRISRYEITRAQFQAVMNADPTPTDRTSGTGDPVQYVTWYQAIAFCNKLSLLEGLSPVYSVTGTSGVSDWAALPNSAIPTSSNADWNAVSANWNANGYRLPTEMEWMWAAMGAPADGQGGGTNSTGYAKPFAGSNGSNAIGDYAVFGYSGTETGRTTTQRSNPVGSKLPNELGLYDMSGNVWELCWDLANSFPSGILVDYRGGSSGTNRQMKGGDWSYNGTNDTIAKQIPINVPNSGAPYRGLRLVRP